MKRVKTAVLGLSMIAAVGLVGIAPQAEALTIAPPSVCLGYTGAGTDSIAFIVGEDGRVWYTQTTTNMGVGAFVGLAKTPAGNPFFAAVPNPATSPLSGFVNPATFPSGAGNFGIWVPIPGGVTFLQTTPTCVNRPLNAGAGVPAFRLGAAAADNLVILVAGLDKRVWHTVFDGDGDGVFNDAEVLTSGFLATGSNMWFTATDAPGTADGWASTIVGGAGPLVPWVPLP